MNTNDIHARAEQLIAQELVEGISSSDQRFLEQHLRECESCASSADALHGSLRALKSIAVPVPVDLAQRTQFRVRLRAQQMSHDAPQRRLLWASCGASWVFGAVSAPYVWRALQWLGERVSLPRVVPAVGFGLWWALPAIVALGIVFAENAKQKAERDWVNGQGWD